jgi:hypothetical protein
MVNANVKYYARMDYNPKSGKTPKYTITAQCGFMPEMDALKGKDGKINVYLMEKLKDGCNVPSTRLQAKNSLNLTGLKDYFVDGKVSGYAYGNPPETPTYSSKNKPNPFFTCRNDGFLFVIHFDKNEQPEDEAIKPTCIEMLVLAGAKVMISTYCKQLVIGGFDEVLAQMRQSAISL